LLHLSFQPSFVLGWFPPQLLFWPSFILGWPAVFQYLLRYLFQFCNMTIQLSTTAFIPAIQSVNPAPLLTSVVACMSDSRWGLYWYWIYWTDHKYK
jgi:hypothetical protein